MLSLRSDLQHDRASDIMCKPDLFVNGGEVVQSIVVVVVYSWNGCRRLEVQRVTAQATRLIDTRLPGRDFQHRLETRLSQRHVPHL